MKPSKPYLIRALYEWILDNELTPHLLVDVRHGDVEAPLEFADGDRLVLNVSPRAVQSLLMGNETIEFQARFGGVARFVRLPVARVAAIYARENGQGMLFGEGDESASVPPAPSGEAGDERGGDNGDDTPPPSSGPPRLRVVK